MDICIRMEVKTKNEKAKYKNRFHDEVSPNAVSLSIITWIINSLDFKTRG